MGFLLGFRPDARTANAHAAARAQRAHSERIVFRPRASIPAVAVTRELSTAWKKIADEGFGVPRENAHGA